MLWNNFRSDVDMGFGMFLQTHAFVEEEFVQEEHVRAVFYRSPLCKICVYQSALAREINCLVAKPGTKNSIHEKDGWYPYRLLLLRAGVELDASVPVRTPPRAEIFREFSSELSAHFDQAVSAL